MHSVIRVSVLIVAVSAAGAWSVDARAQGGRLLVTCKASSRAVVADVGPDDVVTRVEVDGRAVPLLPTDRFSSGNVQVFCGPTEQALAILRDNQAMNESGGIRRSATPASPPTGNEAEPRASGLRQGGGFGAPSPPPPTQTTVERTNFIGQIAGLWREGGVAALARFLMSPGTLLTIAVLAVAFLLSRFVRRKP